MMKAYVALQDVLQGNDGHSMVTFALESKYGLKVIDDRTQADFLVIDRWIPKTELLDSAKIVFVGRGQGLDELHGDPKLLACLSPTEGIDGITNVLEGLLKKDELATDDYCRISTNLLVRVVPLKADIYIRLSEKKYIKLFREGDVFDNEDLKRYLLEKKIAYFYLKKTEIKEFLDKFSADLTAIANQDVSRPDDLVAISESVHETLQDMIAHLGPTEELQAVVKQHVSLAVKNLTKNPSLNDIISRLKDDPTKYIANHSILVGNLACAIAAGMEWNSDSTFSKLIMAGLLHDITVKNQSLAAIDTIEELSRRRGEFTPQEVQMYRLHSVGAADMVRRFKEVPPDVDLIILQHHEKPNETGFPRRLTANWISPLAAIFIVAHEIIHFVYRTQGGMIGFSFDKKRFFEEYGPLYSSGNFKKAMTAVDALRVF